MNPNKALWEKGDFTKLAATFRENGIDFVSNLGIIKGMKVLDLGCGDGTTAIPAAKLGADVLGVDIASNLVAAGNARAKAEGLANISFQEGDACDLNDLEDNSFELVVSIFGAMFAPKPMEVAREMVRVTKPGGRIVMGNWIPGDPTLVAQVLRICSAYMPPPPQGFVSPMLWGTKENAGLPEGNISFEKEAFTFRAPYPPVQYLQLFRDYYGPTMNAFEAAEKNGRANELQQELETLFNSQNNGPADQTQIDANFLKVTIVK